MDSALMITNAGAGSNDTDAVDAALAVLRASGITVEVAATSDLDELRGVLAERRGRDLIVAGGDGSLHAVIAVLQSVGELDQPVLGLIPLGTGNDFARGVKLPLDPADAADVIVSGRVGAVDILTDDDDGVVVNAVHAGVGAEAGREAESWKSRLGKLGYVVGAVIAGVKSQGHRLKVVADGEVLADGHRRVLQVGVSNGACVGGGTELSPDADPTDGQVDVLVSFGVAAKDRLLYGIRLKRGTHEERHDVRQARATHVEISGEEFWCNADGELVGPVRSRSWELHPGAVTMLLPTKEQEVEA